MATQVASGWCRNCGRAVKVTRPGRNHLLHLVLTLLTSGLWLFVWVPLMLTSKPWRCSSCGLKTGRE